MELSIQQYESIQKYLDRLMLPEEEKAFLEEVSRSIAMKEHLGFEQELRDQLFFLEMEKDFPGIEMPDTDAGIDSEEVADIKKRIADVGKNWKEKQKRIVTPVTAKESDDKIILLKKPKVRSWGMLAAACTIIAVMGIILLLSGKQKNSNTIVSTGDSIINKKPPVIIDPNDTSKHIIPVIPGRQPVNYAAVSRKYYRKDRAPDQEKVPQYLEDVLADFDDGNYDGITAKVDVDHPPKSRGIDEGQTIKDLGHYYKGLAFIEKKDNKQAIKNLQWVVDSAKTGTYVVKAQWYLGLTYLEEGKIERAEFFFKILADNLKATSYGRQARDVLKEMK